MKLSAISGGRCVVMRGSYGEGNLGDDVLMLAAHALLRRVFEAREISVALGAMATSDGAQHAAKLLPDSTFLPHRGGAGSRLAVWGGGTQWCSFPRTAPRSQPSGRLVRRWRAPSSAVGYAVHRLDGRLRPPIASAAVGVGIGPFADEGREIASAQQLREMQFVAVRDEISKGYCDSWGLENVILGADLCFVDERWRSRSEPHLSLDTRKPSVGVIVRDWPHDDEGGAYETPLLHVIAALRAQGLLVEFISFSAKADARWLHYLRRVGERVVQWNVGLDSPEDLLRAQASYDCLISTRYHGALFGALGGIPVICIDIEPKLRVAADTIHGRLWRKPFDETELLALVAAVTESPAAEMARIIAAIETQERRAAVMVSRFLDFVKSSVLHDTLQHGATHTRESWSSQENRVSRVADVSTAVRTTSDDHPLDGRSSAAPLRVAIAHDWLVNYAGSERVLEQIRSLFPDARLLTTLLDERMVPAALRSAETAFLQAIPGAAARHEWFLPFMPLDWRLRRAVDSVDVVISSSHACATAVRVRAGIPHICYCHTPMRYAWDYDAERQRFPYVLRFPARAAMVGFRRWDKRAARRVTHFIANSYAVAERIRSSYGRPATVVHPPVDTTYFTVGGRRLGYYLYAGRLVSYKRPDLLVDAFAELPDEELTIAGTGPMLDKLRARATPNVRFVVSPDDRELRELYRGASAFLQAGEEDFGIAMVEAQSCGAPVIALGRGGALDIVSEGENGLTFNSPTSSAIQSAIRRARVIDWDDNQIAASASRFSEESFRRKIWDEVARVVALHRDGFDEHRISRFAPVVGEVKEAQVISRTLREWIDSA